MHQVSKPRAANQPMTEESGRPGTSRSKVGCDAIDEPCTNSTVPFFAPAPPAPAVATGGFCHKNSFTPPLLVQCSLPFTPERGADAAGFIASPAEKAGS